MRSMFCSVLLVALALSGENAFASLGANVSSVQTDQVKLSAAHRAEPVGALVVHSLTQADGAIVKEFADSHGQVIAVTWSGAALPNFRQILGDQYAQRLNEPHEQHIISHRVLSIHDADLVIESSGSMRAGFTGRAYLTSALSAGVTADQFK